MEDWAQRILKLLKEGESKGLSEAGLARACKLQQPSVWQWFYETENKKTTKNIAAINAVRAAKYLGTTAEYIVTGELSSPQNSELDLSMLQSAIVSVKESLRASGLELDAFVASPMIAFAYRERLKHPRVMSKAQYIAFDNAMAEKLRGELGEERSAGPAAKGSAGSDVEIEAGAATPGRGRRSG